jgi:MFS family permease
MRAGFGVAPGPLFVAVLAPRFGALAGRIGQRPILIAGGLAYAAGGAYRLWVLGPEQRYFVDYLPSMVLTGIGVACCFPQLSSVVAQALPPNRIGIGGASLQALRQFGGTFGVALAIAFIGQPAGLDEALSAFDRVWWLIVAGGVATTVLVLPMRTGPSVPVAVSRHLTEHVPG